MEELFSTRPAWFVLGPLIGLVVVGLYATVNERIGVMGGYSGIFERATGRASELNWRVWFLFGVLGGAVLVALLAGGSTSGDGYGWLTRTFDSDLVIGGALLIGGALVGFGAKTAGGCTSGNGLGGCSTGSPGSFAATVTFMGTAVVASFVIKALT